MNRPLLALKRLKFGFSGRRILDTFDLELPRGEIVGLIGPNGCGKTTLFNCVCGFLSLAEGRVELEGEDISHLSVSKRAQAGLGRVFQNAGIFPSLTVDENMRVALEAELPWYRVIPRLSSEERERIDHLLDEVSLIDFKEQPASLLSGGQARLLEIQRASLLNPKVLLLDEPTAGVAPKLKTRVIELLRKQRDLGMTALIIEHDLSFLSDLCDEVVLMSEGRAALQLPPAELRESELFRSIYLGFGDSTRAE